MPDCLADPEYKWFESQKIGKFRTMLGVPLLREGSPIGVLALTRSQVEPFSDREIGLVTTFADQAVIAIENVRLFDEVQARTRELSEALSSRPRRRKCSRSFPVRQANWSPCSRPFWKMRRAFAPLISGCYGAWRAAPPASSRASAYRRPSRSSSSAGRTGPGRSTR